MKQIYMLTAFAMGWGIPHIAAARTVTFGLDMSTSNPLVVHQPYANLVANFSDEKIRDLTIGDWIIVKTFGERGLKNIKTIKVRLSKRNRPKATAKAIAKLIRETPRRKSESQSATNITAFLEFNEFDCGNGGEIVLITDGIESSEAVNAGAFLKGKVRLPDPDEGVLSGCSVTMLGIGQDIEGPHPPRQVKNIRKAWRKWMKQAGATFTPIINP